MKYKENCLKNVYSHQVIRSPLWRFRHEYCNRCPLKNGCNENNELELRCLLSKIALDLHDLTGKTMLATAHL